MLNISDMKTHVEQLAHGLGVTITWNNSDSYGAADAIKPEIDVPIIRNEAHYAIALHELGHKAVRKMHNWTVLQFALDRYQAEVDAWGWAKSVAIKWTDEMEKQYKIGLGSYEMFRVRPELALLEFLR